MSWSESSQTPISATLFPTSKQPSDPTGDAEALCKRLRGQFRRKHHMDAVNLEPVSPNSCFQQEKDVGLVKMLPRFLHHSWQGERMTTATALTLQST